MFLGVKWLSFDVCVKMVASYSMFTFIYGKVDVIVTDKVLSFPSSLIRILGGAAVLYSTLYTLSPTRMQPVFLREKKTVGSQELI